MLKETEKKELVSYQSKLIQMQKEKQTGHLSSNERDKITILYSEGLSVRKIASCLGRSPSTISRELRRKETVFNGIIRRFFPKGTNFDTITEEEIAFVENWINNRPMKVLGYKTPNEKFQELSVAIA